MAIPASRTKIYAGLTIEQSIAQAKIDGKALLSSVTQDQYLATLRAILDLAAKKRLVPVNAAANMKPLKKDNVSASAKRLPFSPSQLKAFFESEFYRECGQHSPAYARDKGGWRFWMPLVALLWECVRMKSVS